MHNSGATPIPLRNLLFIQKDIELATRPPGWKEIRSLTGNSYLLLVLLEGEACLQLQDNRYALTQGDCYLLPPDTQLELENLSAETLCCFELAFGRVDESETGGGHEAFPFTGKLNALPFPRLRGYMERLLEHKDEAYGLQALRNHICFQELLVFLFEQNDPARRENSSVLAVEQTIATLRLGFNQPVRVDQLAQQANIGIWQYRQLFKRITGRNPNEYMTELRINRAKELLLASKASLGEIAQSVGYQDVYYFNRIFRKIVGASPRQYIRHQRSQMRVVALSHLGDILSLGMKPLAADDQLLHWLDRTYTQGIEGIEASAGGLEKVAALRPDLILINAHTDAAFADSLKRIAPTVMLETEGDLFQRLRELAELLGRQHEAKAWLEQYENKAKRVREQLKATIGRKETAIFFHVVDGEIYLHQPQECPVLYDVLGFEPPDGLKRLMNTRSSRLFIPADAFAEYEADRIFIVFGQMSGARETFDRIVHSPQWRALSAVRGKRAYYMSEYWTFDGTIALDWQLDGIMDLLAGGDSLYW